MITQAKLSHPVEPFRGFRLSDDWGQGGFGASRTKAGKAYPHKGIDCLAKCDPELVDRIVSPMNAKVSHVGVAYPDDPLTPEDERKLGSIWLEGVREWEGLMAKILYLTISRQYGDMVMQGAQVGLAGDRAGYAVAAAKAHPELPKGPMLNHIHFELYERIKGIWVLTDPNPYLKVPYGS